MEEMSYEDLKKYHLWARHCEPEDCAIEPLESSSVSGDIPDWLNGVLYRTGAGVQTYGDGVYYKHAFDGMAILHAFEIRGGKLLSHTNHICSFTCPTCINRQGKIPQQGSGLPIPPAEC